MHYKVSYSKKGNKINVTSFKAKKPDASQDDYKELNIVQRNSVPYGFAKDEFRAQIGADDDTEFYWGNQLIPYI